MAIPSEEGLAQIKAKLAESLGVSVIPELALINTKRGEFIWGGEARDMVMDVSDDMKKVIATVAKWKVAKRHPMWKAPGMMDKGANSRSFVGKVLSFMARNPMIIIGFMYLYKWVQKQMNPDEDNSPPEVESTSVVEDWEF